MCATLADAAGVSRRVVPKLMRNSTLQLTGKFTRSRAWYVHKAAQSLPSLGPVEPIADLRAGAREVVDTQLMHKEGLAYSLPTATDASLRTATQPLASTASIR